MTEKSVVSRTDLGKILSGPEGDFMREAVRGALREFMEAEVASLVGAGTHERSEERLDYRNGFRPRQWETRLGPFPLEVPRVRYANYLPSFLEPRRRAEQALVSVVQEAFVHGVSTRRVDELVQAMGGGRLDKSAVSRFCQQLDEAAQSFRTRTLEGEYPYVWLDALYEKVRDGGHVRSMAVVIAIAVSAEGCREVLGVEVGHAESEEFWKEFLRGLVKRGLRGVQLVISDAHEGLKKAIERILTGAVWQRCRVHLMRNLLGHVPRPQQAMVLAAVKTIFAQSSQVEARRQLRQVVRAVRPKCPRAAELLLDAEEEVLAYMAFPPEHWRQIHSTNPLERQNKEIRRRTRVIGIFPHRASLLRLVTLLLSEQHDEWQALERVYFSRRSIAKITASVKEPPALMKEVATA